MKNLRNWAFLTLMAFATFSCGEEEGEGAATPKSFSLTEADGMITIKGSIDENVTLSASKIYLLEGFVYVASGATLTIQPGTVIKGDQASNGSLIVERGAKIMAEGTVAKPIVFTSAKPKGSRKAGDWGGIIILGNAPVNLPNAKIEGGVDRSYGGTDANDNSGVLKYVRIEYSGIAFQPDNEVNGLTLGGVGAGTIIDYVQVSYNGDDAFEFFGGTVNAKHLIAYKTVDDMFDTDNGYSGKLQFLVGLSDPNVADASGSNGFESDGDSQGSDATPKTAAVFSNVSLFGPLATTGTPISSNFKRAMHIRRNSSISVYNSVFAGWPVGLLLDGTKSQANATTNGLKINNTVIAGSPAPLTVESGSAFNVANWYNTAGSGNSTHADYTGLNIAGAFSQTAPDFRPGAGSTLLTGASFTGLTGFETVAYKGAFGTINWAEGWTSFDPQNVNY